MYQECQEIQGVHQYAKCTRSANGLALTGRAMPATSQQMAVEGLDERIVQNWDYSLESAQGGLVDPMF